MTAVTLNDGIFGMAALKPSPNPVRPPASTGSRLGAGFAGFSTLPGSAVSTEVACDRHKTLRDAA